MKGGMYMAIFFRNKKIRRMLGVALITSLIILENVIVEKEILFANQNLSMYSGGYALMDGETGRLSIEFTPKLRRNSSVVPNKSGRPGASKRPNSQIKLYSTSLLTA